MPFTLFNNKNLIAFFGEAQSRNSSTKSGTDDDEIVVEVMIPNKSP